MAFELATVTAHIAGLTVTGKSSSGADKTVTLNDFDSIKEQADIRLCPQFQPDITRQVTFQAIERNSFGNGAVAKQTLYYTIPYVLLYEPISSTRGLIEVFPNMIYTMSAIITELIEHDTPSNMTVDMQINEFTLGGTVNDPSGAQFHGVNVSVIVREFIL